VPEPLTDDEIMVLKTAAFGAVYLVSDADPGVFSLIRESFAASSAIVATDGLVRRALTTGHRPTLPSGPVSEVTASVLATIREATRILRDRAPGELDDYRAAVLTASDEVAKASRGVHPDEAAMIDRIRAALA
jgi:hypothetical protein